MSVLHAWMNKPIRTPTCAKVARILSVLNACANILIINLWIIRNEISGNTLALMKAVRPSFLQI